MARFRSKFQTQVGMRRFDAIEKKQPPCFVELPMVLLIIKQLCRFVMLALFGPAIHFPCVFRNHPSPSLSTRLPFSLFVSIYVSIYVLCIFLFIYLSIYLCLSLFTCIYIRAYIHVFFSYCYYHHHYYNYYCCCCNEDSYLLK